MFTSIIVSAAVFLLTCGVLNGLLMVFSSEDFPSDVDPDLF